MILRITPFSYRLHTATEEVTVEDEVRLALGTVKTWRQYVRIADLERENFSNSN
jgi:hypothetical protein